MSTNDERMKDILHAAQERVRRELDRATLSIEHETESAIRALAALAAAPPPPLVAGKEPVHLVAVTLRDPMRGKPMDDGTGRLTHVGFDFQDCYGGNRYRDPTCIEGRIESGPFKTGKNYLAVVSFYELPDDVEPAQEPAALENTPLGSR